MANSREVRRLPKEGIKVAIDGLDPLRTEKLHACTIAYIQACGCAAGGAVAMIALLAVLIAIGFGVALRGPRWTDIGETLAGVIGAVLLGGVAKMFWIVLARLRFERNCRDVIRVLSMR